MPDAALSFAIGAATREGGGRADKGADAFAPMMDWFLGAGGEGRTGPRRDRQGTWLTPARVLDRLLWFDSAGYVYFKGWFWVKDGEREAVVKIAAAYEGAAPDSDRPRRRDDASRVPRRGATRARG